MLDGREEKPFVNRCAFPKRDLAPGEPPETSRLAETFKAETRDKADTKALLINPGA